MSALHENGISFLFKTNKTFDLLFNWNAFNFVLTFKTLVKILYTDDISKNVGVSFEYWKNSFTLVILMFLGRALAKSLKLSNFFDKNSIHQFLQFYLFV